MYGDNYGDLPLLGPFTAVFITREGPDYGVHSIVGLVLLIPVLVHLSSKLGWIARACSRAGWPRKRPNSRLNAALALATATVIIIGIPAWTGASLSNAPHAISGLASIALAPSGAPSIGAWPRLGPVECRRCVLAWLHATF